MLANFGQIGYNLSVNIIGIISDYYSLNFSPGIEVVGFAYA